jgi:hypothetical protein
MSPRWTGLLERLRDDVLTPGPDRAVAAAFLAALRHQLQSGGSAGLHDIGQALTAAAARGEPEMELLAALRAARDRLLAAAERLSLAPEQSLVVRRAVTQVVCAGTRALIALVLGRVARQRAAQLREELAQSRLREALARQREELVRLQALD